MKTIGSAKPAAKGHGVDELCQRTLPQRGEHPSRVSDGVLLDPVPPHLDREEQGEHEREEHRQELRYEHEQHHVR